jgi:hypothetical protein
MPVQLNDYYLEHLTERNMTTPAHRSYQTVLDYPLLSRIRRNHGLEHATLHVLSGQKPRTPMAGHSDMKGFWLLGDVSTEEVQSAVNEALRRLRAGERSLAVHPNCGTNIVTSGILAGVAAFVGLFGAGRRLRDKLERLPLVVTLATLALIVSQPLGRSLQENVTTSADLGDLEVVEIRVVRKGRAPAHRIVTRG